MEHFVSSTHFSFFSHTKLLFLLLFSFSEVEHFVTHFPIFSHMKLLFLLLFSIIILDLMPNVRKLINNYLTCEFTANNIHEKITQF